MKLASTIRLGVKQERLVAEKTFDAKRSEVQQLMIGYKTEDALWLKAKQTMIILTKEIEETARWKEETAERIEKERKELQIQERILKVSKFAPEMARSEFENMSNDSFAIFLAGIEKAFNDKIEAEKKAEAERIEKENINKLYFQRLKEISIYSNYCENIVDINSCEWGVLSETEFNDIKNKLESSKAEKDTELEAQRIENERLKAEAEEKQKQLEAERLEAKKKADEAEAKAKAEHDKARKEKEALEAKLKEEAEKARLEKELLEAKLKAREAEEARLRAEAEEKQKQKEKEEEKTRKAPIKKKLEIWVDSFSLPSFEENETAKDILSKFNAFKEWAKIQINK